MAEKKKKILGIIICFILVGIVIIILINYKSNSWKNEFGISSIYIEKIGELYPSYYINGSIQNKTGKDISLLIDVELRSGSIIKYETCTISLSYNETKDIDCPISSDNNIDDTYTATIKNIRYY